MLPNFLFHKPKLCVIILFYLWEFLKCLNKGVETTKLQKAPNPFSVSEYSANPGSTAWLAVFKLQKEHSHVLKLPLYSSGNSSCILSNLTIINVMHTPDSISDWYLLWKCEYLLKKGEENNCKFPTLLWYSVSNVSHVHRCPKAVCTRSWYERVSTSDFSLIHQGSRCRSSVLRKHRPGCKDSLHHFYYPFCMRTSTLPL